MPLFDLPIAELRSYRPTLPEPPDFDAFWAGTLAAARRHDIAAEFRPLDANLATVEAFDVTFAGWNGEPVRGWLLLPRERVGALPCVVTYIGYTGGRGLVHDHLLYASAGYANLVMDSRGQGGADTGDPGTGAGGPQAPGFMTEGVLDPDTYYYRRLMTDAARAVDAARSHPSVDPARIAVAGGSQGGGLTLAAAGLVPDVVGALPDVPFLCHYRRAAEVATTGPYPEIARLCAQRPHLVDRIFATLGYFDGVSFAARARAAALFSVGIMDTTCPPSTVFAAYNNYGGPKEIREWPFNNHEGGGSYQATERLVFLKKLFG